MDTFAGTCRKNLVAIAGAYAKATRTSLEQVSKRFYGNRGFLRAFKAGERSVSIDKLDEMVAAFIETWPEGADWPQLRAVVIARPAPRRKSVPRKVSEGSGARAANHLPGPHE